MTSTDHYPEAERLLEIGAEQRLQPSAAKSNHALILCRWQPANEPSTTPGDWPGPAAAGGERFLLGVPRPRPASTFGTTAAGTAR
jgi:hypothetical protein